MFSECMSSMNADIALLTVFQFDYYINHLYPDYYTIWAFLKASGPLINLKNFIPTSKELLYRTSFT